MPLPTLHPVEKTAQELRRSIDRITIYLASEPEDAEQVRVLQTRLAKSYDAIPDKYKGRN